MQYLKLTEKQFTLALTCSFIRQGVPYKIMQATGLDGVFIECIRASQHEQIDFWTKFFNESMKVKNIPQSWRRCIQRYGRFMLSKCLQGNSSIKVFSKLLTQKLAKAVDAYMLHVKFSIQRGRLTTHTVNNILNDRYEMLHLPMLKFYTVSVDFIKMVCLLKVKSKVVFA